MSSIENIRQAVSTAQRSDQPPGLLSVREVAAYLGVSERTVRRWEGEGRLVSLRLSTGTIRFTRAAVTSLIRGHGSANEQRPGYADQAADATSSSLDARDATGPA
jgi:excisionase family DNA binding protein